MSATDPAPTRGQLPATEQLTLAHVRAAAARIAGAVVQTPMLQNMMNSYIDQSKNLFVQMQDQMQDQTRSMFSNFPFNPPGSGPRGK